MRGHMNVKLKIFILNYFTTKFIVVGCEAL
jgi:hypothetical protein